MFAVPGWSLSGKGPVQEQPKTAKNKEKFDKQLDSLTPSRKRKRNQDSTRPLKLSKNVTSRSREEQPKNEKRQNDLGSKGRGKSTRHDTRPTSSSAAGVSSNENTTAGSDITTSSASRNKVNTDEAMHNQSQPKEMYTLDARKQKTAVTAAIASLESIPSQSSTNTLTPLQAKMRQKLTSARFRHLNETLYTTTSTSAFQLFTSSPELFAEYHAGFSQQVKDSWPQNPVDEHIRSLRRRGGLSHPQNDLLPLPRRKTGSCTVADLGCGDAPLARGCQSFAKKTNIRFHSYDLHAPNFLVTVADISNLPLRDGEADIAVFCLSLMGTNWIDFVEEAWRIVRGDGKGEVWVAEVKSRFVRVKKDRVVENSVGKKRKGHARQTANEDEFEEKETQFVEDARTADSSADETDISEFVKVFQKRGFYLKEGSVEKSNKMFVSMIFVKSGVPQAGKHQGMKWNGSEYQRITQAKAPKHTFANKRNGHPDADDSTSPSEEAKVLKPCVYKTR